jgi:IPT/TIG domain
VILSALEPAIGSNTGGTVTTVWLADGAYPADSTVQCLVDVAVPSNISSSTSVAHHSFTVPAALVARLPQQTGYQCAMPSLESFYDALYGAAVWPTAATGATASVQLTANNAVDTAGPALAYTYIPVVAVTAIAPATGSSAGGTVVELTGTGYSYGAAVDDGAAVQCSFNGQVVPGSFRSDSVIACTAPAHTPAAYEQSIVLTTAGAPTAETQAVQLWQVQGSALGGSFTVTLDGYTSGPIAVGATAAAFTAALSTLPTAGTVTVTAATAAGVADAAYSGALFAVTTWTVQFTQRTGDVPAMTTDVSGLLNTSAGERVVVSTLVQGGAGGAVPEVQVCGTFMSIAIVIDCYCSFSKIPRIDVASFFSNYYKSIGV